VGALAGLRVVDAGLIVQGPQAAAPLADWGAVVVKVELPGVGDQSRYIPISPAESRSGYFEGCNRGKRSLTLDLRHPRGREVFLKLTDQADVVISNFRPGTMEEWGLGYDVLGVRNPALVYAAGSTFGPLGPDAGQEGNDLSGQAAGGLISTTGVDGGEPTPVGATIADHIASLNLVAGILAALVARGTTGRGQRVEASLLGGQIWAQASEITAYLMTGSVPGRPNRGNPLVPGLYAIFPTADGWIAICGVRGSREHFFAVIGRPDLLDKYDSPLYWREDQERLYEELAPVFASRTTSEWCELLQQVNVRHSPVRDYAAIAGDPGVWDNGYLFRAPSGAAVVGTPVRFSDTPAAPGWQVPELGQHTEEVLLELGYTWDEIRQLAEMGAI
jgi:CoA:oxalate CoA-transferase